MLLSLAVMPAFMSFGFSEILLIGIVALLVFGGNLPDVMRSLGRSYGKLRASLHEFSRPVREELRDVKRMPQTPKESRPVPEYPEYGGPPITTSPELKEGDNDGEEVQQDEQAQETKAPASGVIDEPPPV